MNKSKKQTITKQKKKSGTLSHAQVSKLTTLGVLTAVIVVLQTVSTALTRNFAAPCITFALVPIVIGAAFYGKGAGAFLGAVFGLIAFIYSATGFDYQSQPIFAANPFMCFVVCMVKGAASGFCAGLVYRLVCGKGPSSRREYVAALLAALTAPVVNTGIFCISLPLFFRELMLENMQTAGIANAMQYIIFAVVGINFLVETGVNLVFSPAINSIVRAVKKSK